MGREWTVSDRRSRPVPTADGLTTPTGPRAGFGTPVSAILDRDRPHDAMPEDQQRRRRRRPASPAHSGRGPGPRDIPPHTREPSSDPSRTDLARIRRVATPIALQRPTGAASPPAGRFPGDHTCGAPPVPIPNTAVKPAGPMIVLLARKSVIAGVQPTPPHRPGHPVQHRMAGAAVRVEGRIPQRL